MQCLKEIHRNNIILRDLKQDNIFFTSDLKVKIGDFDISKQLNSAIEYIKTQIGTMLYLALEIIMGAEYNNRYDKWSLGYINHELFAINFCSDSQSYKELINNIKEYKYEKINQEIYGLELQKIKYSLLNKDYNRRPKIKEIIKKAKE